MFHYYSNVPIFYEYYVCSGQRFRFHKRFGKGSIAGVIRLVCFSVRSLLCKIYFCRYLVYCCALLCWIVLIALHFHVETKETTTITMYGFWCVLKLWKESIKVSHTPHSTIEYEPILIFQVFALLRKTAKITAIGRIRCVCVCLFDLILCCFRSFSLSFQPNSKYNGTEMWKSRIKICPEIDDNAPQMRTKAIQRSFAFKINCQRTQHDVTQRH